MLIYIENKVKLVDPTEAERKFIKEKLTLNNPKFEKLERMGKYAFGEAPIIPFYEDRGSILKIPVGALPEILDLVSVSKDELIDKRFESKVPVNLQFTGKLRPYQQKAVDTMLEKTIGVVEAPTGSGKTVMIIDYITRRKQPTLIMVNTIELMNQMIARLEEFTDLKKDAIGIIGNGEWKVRDITVCTLQTMHKLNDVKYKFLNEYFGQVIVDEVHIVPAHTFYDVITKLKAKYKFGFSATPQRDDGLTQVIFWATGPKIFKVTLNDVKHKVMIPEIRRINTDYYFPLFSSDEYSMMVDDLCANKDRNKLILKTAEEYRGKQIVILTTRVSHVLELTEALNADGFNAAYLVSRLKKSNGKFSAMPKKKREEVIQGLENKKLDAVVSTYSLFATGIDLAGLEILFFAGPTRSEMKVKQSIGRIMRKAHASKKPVIVDFRDVRVDLLKFQGYARNKAFKYLKEIT